MNFMLGSPDVSYKAQGSLGIKEPHTFRMNWSKLTLCIFLALTCAFAYTQCYTLERVEYVDNHTVNYSVTFPRTGAFYDESFTLTENTVQNLFNLRLKEGENRTFKIAPLVKKYEFLFPNGYYWRLSEAENGFSELTISCDSSIYGMPSFIKDEIITLTENPLPGDGTFCIPLPFANPKKTSTSNTSTSSTMIDSSNNFVFVQISDHLQQHADDCFVADFSYNYLPRMTRSFLARYAYLGAIYYVHCNEEEYGHHFCIFRLNTLDV